MRVHLYEFRSQTRKLKCSCGWERTMKSGDMQEAAANFKVHQKQAATTPA